MDLDLLTIGDCSIDLYMKVEDSSVFESGGNSPKMCFYHGSKIPVEKFASSIAGNACHVSVGAKKMGLGVGIYTELGDDDNASRFIKEFNGFDIDTRFCIRNKETETNVHAVIIYRDDRTIFSYHRKRDYRLYKWPTPKWVFYSSLARGFEKFQKDLVEYLSANPSIAVAFNPGTLQLEAGVDKLKNILAITDVLFVNKEEAQILLELGPSSNIGLKEMHEQLMRLGPKLVVITNSKEGSSAYDGNSFIEMPSYKIATNVVDKTGAGDAYASAFIAALFYKKPLKTAMIWGSRNAANKIQHIGGVTGVLSKEEIDR